MKKQLLTVVLVLACSVLLGLEGSAAPDSAVKGPFIGLAHIQIQTKDLEKSIQFYVENLFGGIRGAFLSGPSGESIELFQYLKAK